MEFEWDEANRDHVAHHGLTPEDAERALTKSPLELAAVNRKGESRRLTIGLTDTGRLLAVVSTERKGRVRVITAYPANRKQRRIYEENEGQRQT